MTPKKNVFTSDLESLIDELVTLRHYQFFIEGHLKEGKKRVEKSLQTFVDKGWDTKDFVMASRMTIFDVFHKKGGDWLLIAPTTGRLTAGKDILRMADETERRFSSWLAVALYERLEAFLKAVFGKLLYQLRDKTAVRDKTRFHTAKPVVLKCVGTASYFAEYAQYACRRDCKIALSYFREQLNLKSFVLDHYWRMSFEEFATALGEARHAIVHSQGRISESKTRSLTKRQRAFLEKWLHEGLYERGERLLPEGKLIEKCYEVVGSYGRGLYVLLAEKLEMADESMYFK
jgi:hypothetical protein